MKSQTMTVEPYNFTLSYTHLVRSSSMIATFSNQQTMSYLQRHSAVSQPESCYYPLINTKLGSCFKSIFSTDIDGNLQDICKNICATPQINQCLVSDLHVSEGLVEKYLVSKYNNE